MKLSCELALAHGMLVYKPAPVLTLPGRPRKVLGIGGSPAQGATSCVLPADFPYVPLSFSPSGVSPDATANWLLFILHAFTFQAPRKCILKSACLWEFNFILAENVFPLMPADTALAEAGVRVPLFQGKEAGQAGSVFFQQNG